MPSKSLRLFVEVGRVCVVNNGPGYGKVCVIVEIIDQNRSLVDGPESITGFPRQVMNYKDVDLTKILVKDLRKGATTKELEQAMKKQKIIDSYNKLPVAKRILAENIKKSLNDFERYKAATLRTRKIRMINKIYGDLKRKKIEKEKPKLEKQKKMLRTKIAKKIVFSKLNLIKKAKIEMENEKVAKENKQKLIQEKLEKKQKMEKKN